MLKQEQGEARLSQIMLEAVEYHILSGAHSSLYLYPSLSQTASTEMKKGISHWTADATSTPQLQIPQYLILAKLPLICAIRH